MEYSSGAFPRTSETGDGSRKCRVATLECLSFGWAHCRAWAGPPRARNGLKPQACSTSVTLNLIAPVAEPLVARTDPKKIVPRCQQVPGKQLRDWAQAGEEVRAAGEEAPGVVPRAALAAGGAALAGHGRAALAPLAGREDRRRARISRSAAARAAVVPRRAGRGLLLNNYLPTTPEHK